MWPGDGAVLTSPDGEPFCFNDAAREFFDANSFGDYLVSVVSSDPSVVSVVRDNEAEYLENAYYIEAQKPGTATVTLTLKDKEPVSCKITVKSAANADLSKLKFLSLIHISTSTATSFCSASSLDAPSPPPLSLIHI